MQAHELAQCHMHSLMSNMCDLANLALCLKLQLNWMHMHTHTRATRKTAAGRGLRPPHIGAPLQHVFSYPGFSPGLFKVRGVRVKVCACVGFGAWLHSPSLLQGLLKARVAHVLCMQDLRSKCKGP